MTAEQDRRLQFYGGLVGSFVPLGFFAVSVVLLTWTGSITIRALFGPLVVVVGLIIFLAKDKAAACEALWAGVAEKTLAVIIFAFLGAGVLGQVVGVSGATRAVVWLAHQAGVGETLFVVFTFVAAALIATATGTATGTCITSVPVLYPAAVVLGAHPALVLGAIYSGARLGDNLAPISDTTIASAFTQEATVGEVVRSRLKYVAVAAALSVGLYLLAGLFLKPDAAYSSDLSAQSAEAYARPDAMLMLLAPLLTIYLCLRGRSLIQAIWYGIALGMGVGLTTGNLTAQDLYSVAPNGTAAGALTDGVAQMSDVVFLTIFVMAILGPLKMAGALDATTRAVLRVATTAKKTEFAIFALVTVLYPICASNTPALLFSGPMVRELGARFLIHRCRRANLMDMAGNGISGSLPHINTMLALAGAAMATAKATGAPVVSIGEVGVLAFYPIALTLTALFAIASGWGSRRG